MLVEVLVNTLWHGGKRCRKGDQVDMSDKSAALDAARGLVRIVPVEAAATGDSGDDGQGGSSEAGGTPAVREAGGDAGAPSRKKR